MNRILAAVISSIVLCGCATQDQKATTSHENTAKGAGIGAIAGAMLGAAVNHDNRVKGAAIGAALGGATGAAVGYHKDKQEAELREKLKDSGVDVKAEGDTIKIVLPGSISFDSGSSSLRPTFYDNLQKVAASLNQYPDTKVLVGGYTDNKGSEQVNNKLSLDRANSVAAYLTSQGIAASRLQTAGFGSRFPVADNNNNMGRSENRRVEIKIIAQPKQTAAAG
jgi:outer membrane protein OmpA-like peptidoglycan-associated protein